MELASGSCCWYCPGNARRRQCSNLTACGRIRRFCSHDWTPVSCATGRATHGKCKQAKIWIHWLIQHVKHPIKYTSMQTVSLSARLHFQKRVFTQLPHRPGEPWVVCNHWSELRRPIIFVFIQKLLPDVLIVCMPEVGGVTPLPHPNLARG